MDTGLLLFVAFALVAAAIAYFGWLGAKRRREEFAAFAASQGWQYAAEDSSWVGRWAGRPFGTGDQPRAQNVVTGVRDGRKIVGFDYSYETYHHDSDGNRHTTTHRYGVCAMALPVPLPGLEVTAESLFDRMANALGVDDIELESEEFNRRFRVRGEDRKFASDVLHPQLMEVLLRYGDVGWRIEGDTLVCWDDGKHSPGEVLARLALLDAIADRIPGFVWRDHGADPELADPGEGPQ